MCQITDKMRFIAFHLILTALAVNTGSVQYDKHYFYIDCLQVPADGKCILKLLQFCKENRSCFVCSPVLSPIIIFKSKSQFPTHSADIRNGWWSPLSVNSNEPVWKQNKSQLITNLNGTQVVRNRALQPWWKHFQADQTSHLYKAHPVFYFTNTALEKECQGWTLQYRCRTHVFASA